MNNFLRSGRELPFGQGDSVNVLSRSKFGTKASYQGRSGRPKEENNRNRLLLPLGRYRSDVVFMIFCVLCIGFLVSPAFGQEANGHNDVQPLRIGQKLPEDFWEKEHLFYINGDTIRQTLAEHKGKLLVLDFWMSGCTTCLRHQQEINAFKKAYDDELAVLMVNSKKTKENFEKIDWAVRSDRYKQLGIDRLESIIEDTYLEQLFPYYCFPSYFWINANGVLQTHTFRNLLDAGYQAPFIEK